MHLIKKKNNTWHFKEQSLSRTRVTLDVSTVLGPINMCDVAGVPFALTHSFILLVYRVDIDEIVVTTDSEE